MLFFAAACSSGAPSSPPPAPAPPASRGSDATQSDASSGTGDMPNEWGATHDSGACPVNPPAMWDTALPETSICKDTDPNCIVCPQCTDGGATQLAYVLTDYPRSCGCPKAPDGPDMNCGH